MRKSKGGRRQEKCEMGPSKKKEEMGDKEQGTPCARWGQAPDA